MVEAKIYLFFFITLIFLTTKINSLDNSTVDESNNDDDDDDISELEFEEFKNTVRRYRRLIPYMSSFVANNYVNNQGQNYERDEQLPQPEMLKQTRRLIKPRPVNNYRVSQQVQQQRPTTLIKQDRFVPSIQYDPKDIGNDNDYFRPVQYTSKINNYDDYYREYDRRQNYPDITTQNIQDSRYFSKEQTQRGQVAQNPPIYEHEYSKQKLINPQTEYLIDYIPRLTKQHQQQTQDYYQVEGYEPIRYVKIEPPRSLSYSHPQRLIPQHQFNHHHHHQHQVQQQQQQRNPIIQNDNILKSLQLTNRLPEMLNRDNIDSSIKTLVEILGLLHGKKTEQQKIQLADFNLPINNIKNDHFNKKYIRPKVVTESRYQATSKPLLQSTIDDTDDDLNFKSVTYKNNDKSKIPYSPYKSQTQNPSVIEYYTPTIQDISDNEQPVYDNYDNHHDNIEDEQQKPQLIINNNVKLTNNHDIIDEEEFVSEKNPELPITNIDEKVVGNPLVIPTMAIKYGATRGKPFVDYPAYSSIPKTNFECKKQRYKGFFGDPESECQAWHYCDLNGGKSSFLCPNGTIFSQAALTCDWWFNVKCESTTQLYVLNERLYKFILPIMPKFPEDFTGPEADKYIELKFKEMEEKMKEKKLKKAMEKKTKEKIQSNNNSTM